MASYHRTFWGVWSIRRPFLPSGQWIATLVAHAESRAIWRGPIHNNDQTLDTGTAPCIQGRWTDIQTKVRRGRVERKGNLGSPGPRLQVARYLMILTHENPELLLYTNPGNILSAAHRSIKVSLYTSGSSSSKVTFCLKPILIRILLDNFRSEFALGLTLWKT